MEDAASRHYRFAAVGKSLPNQKKIISTHYRIIHQAAWVCKGEAKPSRAERAFQNYSVMLLDTPADGTELFFDAAVAAVDMPACVVHERFAFGAESCEDECRARGAVGRAYSRAGQVRRAFYDGDTVFHADMRAEPRQLQRRA